MMEKEMSSAERVQARVRAERLRLKVLLNGEDGKVLLDMLEDLYYHGPLVDERAEMTYFNLGRREVVRELRAIRDRVEE